MPDINYFKPMGIPRICLEEIVLTLDEFEAARLADLEGLYQDRAATKMGISRPTFGRILEAAHRKIADALVNGKALKITGGKVAVNHASHLKCPSCCRTFNISRETGHMTCPYCRIRT
jgi:predicted DNA-binding protein (UPF0251 family)